MKFDIVSLSICKKQYLFIARFLFWLGFFADNIEIINHDIFLPFMISENYIYKKNIDRL